jgi:hypothetical protein
MKKLWLFVLWLCTVLFTWNFTQAKDYEYSNLDITANILIDGTIDVKENFTANFFVLKHWIIRDIPLNYSVWWKDFHIEISDINVDWKTFRTNRSNWNIEIKIWDADRTVIWEQNYPIYYSTYGLIRNFSWKWYAELYWNLVGNKFDTNINNVKAQIILPKIYTWLTADNFLITTDWKSKTIDWFEWTVDWSQWDRIIITYDKWLSAYQGITLAIKFPNNYFEFNHDKQAKLIGNSNKTWYSSKTTWNSSLFRILFLWIVGLFVFLGVKFSNSRINLDTSGKSSVISIKSWLLKWDFAKKFPTIIQYDPPEWLNSAEVWLLLHRWALAKDMLSLIYKWAWERLIDISIEETENSKSSWSKEIISIKRNCNISQDSPDYEYKLFNSLIPGKINEIDPSKHLDFRLDTSIFEQYGIDNWWLTYTMNYPKKNLLVMSWIFILLICFLMQNLWFWVVLFFLCFVFIPFITISLHKLNETEEWAKLISHIQNTLVKKYRKNNCFRV